MVGERAVFIVSATSMWAGPKKQGKSMAKVRTKQFRLSEEYHLFGVDCWWAGLLHGGLKEIVSLEWEALGNQVWVLRVNWLPVKSELRLNVGHPAYVDLSNEDLEEIIQELLVGFEYGMEEYNALKAKAEQWGLSEAPPEEDGFRRLQVRDDLDLAERLIATEFLWPRYLEVSKWLKHERTKLQELDRERAARKATDYYPVRVDRGMLREAFLVQLGYDNEWLFDDVEEPHPSGEE